MNTLIRRLATKERTWTIRCAEDSNPQWMVHLLNQVNDLVPHPYEIQPEFVTVLYLGDYEWLVQINGTTHKAGTELVHFNSVVNFERRLELVSVETACDEPPQHDQWEEWLEITHDRIHDAMTA